LQEWEELTSAKKIKAEILIAEATNQPHGNYQEQND
jgi:hypothetical protein